MALNAEIGVARMLAGAVGLEPTVFGTKSRCLTIWPRPNILPNNASVVGDLPLPPSLFEQQESELYCVALVGAMPTALRVHGSRANSRFFRI